MNRPFRYYLRVRYAECDMQRVVFNARYGDYTAVAISEFMRAIGLRREFADGTYGIQWVKQTTEWKAPARFDDVIEASVRTTHVGTTSFTLATEFRLAGEDKLLATVESVLVLIDERTMEKSPLLERHRQALINGAPDTVVDHAGYLQR
ncbi:acyl-CoA thioesterase [Geotalea daltonii FRC-32]|uniref:Acyl-CoA thioesterase n=1 Tax=Geotalea daltonii (strain DSM 22248 / JCM 15807 / FRC-32) TaxID=316067 RepID=B9M8N0_GEODF|nr:thioesterase family protein [Geotalea daltonii]ACM18565.1 acyl-CoA thioesterase [Geotalea daltonii FRC-32]